MTSIEISELIASINALMDEIEANPDARPRLQAQLQETVARLEALGQAVPDSALPMAAETDEGEDFFDNMPV